MYVSTGKSRRKRETPKYHGSNPGYMRSLDDPDDRPEVVLSATAINPARIVKFNGETVGHMIHGRGPGPKPGPRKGTERVSTMDNLFRRTTNRTRDLAGFLPPGECTTTKASK